MSVVYYRQRLAAELAARKERNASYSLRAFGRDLGLSPGNLSRILTGGLRLAPKRADAVMATLELSPTERKLFLESVVADQTPTERSASLRHQVPTEPAHNVAASAFDQIGDWYHYAILELTFVQGFRSSPVWIARQLGISVLEARQAVARLKRLGLLSEQEGALVKTADRIANDGGVPTTASIRKHLVQVFQKALQALETEPYERRVMIGLTVPVDPAAVPAARAMMDEFTDKLGELVSAGKRTELYQLALSFYPLTVGSSKPEGAL